MGTLTERQMDTLITHLVENHEQIEKEYKQSEHRREIVRRSQAKRRRIYKPRIAEEEKVKRTAKKWALVRHLGSMCKRCGYEPKIDDDLCIMEFHHLDRSTKKISMGGSMTRSLPTLIEEVNKCILVCSNCHKRIENGQV